MKQFMDAFQAEAAGLIDQLEHQLLTLEKAPDDAAATRLGFQAAHSLKGAAAMLELQDIRTLTHAMESVLQLGREASLHPAHVAELLLALDLLRELLSGAGTEQPPHPQVPELVQRLEASLRSQPTGAALPPASPLALLVEPSEIAAAIAAAQLGRLGYRVERRERVESLPGVALVVAAGAVAAEDDPARCPGATFTVLSECPATRARWEARRIPAFSRPPLLTPDAALPASWRPPA